MFTLMTHPDNIHMMPQSSGALGVVGDHLPMTADDVESDTGLLNVDACYSFNFKNPVGVPAEDYPDPEPWMIEDYPDGYEEGILTLTGSLVLDVDLAAGGPMTVADLTFDARVPKGASAGEKVSHDYLVQPGDPATGGGYGDIDGSPNAGTYAASAAGGWALSATFDWYSDLPPDGPDTIDITFDDFVWDGFVIPVTELTQAGMDALTLDDPLGYFGGTSADFEAWLLTDIAPRLPADAAYLLFAQGRDKATWNNPHMYNWDPDYGRLTQTILATAVPEPATLALVAAGLAGMALRRRRSG